MSNSLSEGAENLTGYVGRESGVRRLARQYEPLLWAVGRPPRSRGADAPRNALVGSKRCGMYSLVFLMRQSAGYGPLE